MGHQMIRKALLTIGAPALLAFMAWNAYLAVSHLREMQYIAARTLESSTIQTDVSNVLKDLTDMETGQRGYLLTGNPLYLQPYTDAKGKILTDFASLRAGLAARAENERAQESQLESLATSKQAEMERSIGFRQQGYRHRAFMLVDSNEGIEYMDRARELLSALSVAETNNFGRLDSERNTSLGKALVEIIVSNLCLVILTACLIGLVRYQGQMLEQETAKSKQSLAARDLQLEKLTFVLSNQALLKTSAIEANARLLLDNYGGFLPRQGHECAEQIRDASIQMERLRQDLVGSPVSNGNGKAA
jgi:CHASE3 domain sensor protein